MLTLPALLATFTAGLLSFFSPCTVPLLPAYFSCVSGAGAADLRGEGDQPASRFRGRLLVGSLLYVAGFGLVFVLLGIGAGGIGQSLTRAARPVEIVGGVALIVFGLFVLGVVKATPLLRDRRFALPNRLQGGGHLAAFPLGIVFGIGWTPCVGPYLSAALAIAAVGAHAVAGGVLLASYALGLGLPFVLVALAFGSLPELPRRIARWTPALTRIGGVLTLVLGVLLITGRYTVLTSQLAQISVGH